MNGRLSGIGVGPGDPELLTLKALRLVQECDVIVAPGVPAEETVAYHILEQAWPGIREKQVVGVEMIMTKDRAKLKAGYRKAADTVEAFLREGKHVVMPTLGDPTVYSTYMYVHQLVTADGFEAEIIPGITSFCAVAARLNQSLVERSEPLHVIPSSYAIGESLDLKGTRVLMKAASKIGEVKRILLDKGQDAVMIENCGMENEHIYRSAEEIPEDAGYYSLIIVKEK